MMDKSLELDFREFDCEMLTGVMIFGILDFRLIMIFFGFSALVFVHTCVMYYCYSKKRLISRSNILENVRTSSSIKILFFRYLISRLNRP